MTRYRKILVPIGLDGSRAAQGDVDAIARHFGGDVTLLHMGDDADAVVRATRDQAFDLVVMSPSAPIASHALQVLALVECDVLSLAPNVSMGGALRSIVCGVDFTPNDLVVIPNALDVARTLGAKLTLAHVTPSARRYGPGGAHDAPDLAAAFTREATRRMREIVDDTRASDAETIVLGDDDVASGLNEAARRASADLVVIGRRPFPGFAGGTCARVASASAVPVLALRT